MICNDILLHWGWTHEGVGRHPRQDGGGLFHRLGKLQANLQTRRINLLETHTSWDYCRWYQEHWGGVSSRDKQSFSHDSNLKSCVVTRVMHISVFPVSRVTFFHVEGDATVDEGDACLIAQAVIDKPRFHFCYSCLFRPLFNITRFTTQ